MNADFGRLNRWGTARMAKVYPLLREIVPEFAPVCQLANEHFCKLMRSGQKVNLKVLPAVPSSLEQLFRPRIEMPAKGDKSSGVE